MVQPFFTAAPFTRQAGLSEWAAVMRQPVAGAAGCRQAMRLEPSPASHAIVSGMERLYDDALSPRPTPSDPIAEGSTIRLSIDMDLQKALEETSPSTAAIISQDGEVLAFRGTPDDAMLESMVLSIGDEEHCWKGKYDWYSAPFIVYHIPSSVER